MATEIGSRAEAELAIERLFDHLEGWLLQQPEVLLIWMQPRGVRKDVAQAIGDLVTTIPTRENVVGNRSARRRALRAMDAAEREWWKGVKL